MGRVESHRQPIEGRRIALQVLSRRDVKHFAPPRPHVVISITDTHKNHPVLAPCSSRLETLQLTFDDIEPKRKEYYGGKRPMDPAQAEQIRTFIDRHREGIELIVVHCEAGMCRSPAIAAALWRWIEGSRGPFFETFRPNAHVYRTMNEALR